MENLRFIRIQDYIINISEINYIEFRGQEIFIDSRAMTFYVSCSNADFFGDILYVKLKSEFEFDKLKEYFIDLLNPEKVI